MNAMRRQSGMTIIELMIAAALGLVISYFVINIMVSSARNAGVSEGLAQAQETGRLVMAWMTEQTSVGGYDGNYLSGTGGIEPVAELCAGGAMPPAAGADCTFNSDNNTNGGDRIAIRRTAGGLNSGTREQTTCTAQALPAAMVSSGAEIVDVYWVLPNTADADTTNDFQLWCVTYDAGGNPIGAAQSIANGVESIQLLLGIGDNDGSIEHYEEPSGSTNYGRVVSVRIAILARNFSGTTLDRAERTYGLLNSTPVTYDDQVARYVQTGTIWFPNRKNI